MKLQVIQYVWNPWWKIKRNASEKYNMVQYYGGPWMIK